MLERVNCEDTEVKNNGLNSYRLTGLKMLHLKQLSRHHQDIIVVFKGQERVKDTKADQKQWRTLRPKHLKILNVIYLSGLLYFLGAFSDSVSFCIKFCIRN